MLYLKIKSIICLILVLILLGFHSNCVWAINVPDSVLELEQTIMAIAKQSGKTVVSISTQKTERVRSYMRGSHDDLFEKFFQDFFYGQMPTRDRQHLALGSGVIIDSRGYILTNEHVISAAEIITVTLADGRKFNAVLKGSDYRSNLAIIKIEAEDLPFAKMGDSDNVRAGQWAIAIGNPFAFAVQSPKPIINLGIISALHRALPQTASRGRAYLDLIQTDASINPGNSGGPLLNIKGQVIGINVATFSSAGVSDGIGFVIPINDAKILLDKLLKGEEVLYGWLGLEVQELNSVLAEYFKMNKPEGVLIIQVFQNSSAAKAGLQVEDIIIKLDDKPIKNTMDLLREIAKNKAGDDLKVKIIRNGLPRTLRIKMGKIPAQQELIVKTSLPPEQKKDSKTEQAKNLPEKTKLPESAAMPNKSWRGIKVSRIDDDFAKMFNLENAGGVIVTEVISGTQAERAGIKINDIITQINTQEIVTAEQFRESIVNAVGNVLVKTNRGFKMIQE